MKLPTIAKRHQAKTDDELRAEIAGLETERRDRRQTHTHFRELSHAAVDASVEAAAAELRRLLDHRWATVQGPLPAVREAGGGPAEIERLGSLASAAGLNLAEEWHAAVLRKEGGFSPRPLTEIEAEREKTTAAINERKVELARRRIDAKKAAVEAELNALEALDGNPPDVDISEDDAADRPVLRLSYADSEAEEERRAAEREKAREASA